MLNRDCLQKFQRHPALVPYWNFVSKRGRAGFVSPLTFAARLCRFWILISGFGSRGLRRLLAGPRAG
jgi:hypothetical protein